MANEAILIVDDNPVNMKLVRILLTGAGCPARLVGATSTASTSLVSIG